jgi:hypothetical protein
LEFQVAGKSAKQLLEFLKLYDTDAAARLKAVTERYPLMVAVQDRLEELKAEATGGKAAAAEPEESTKSGRSKVRRLCFSPLACQKMRVEVPDPLRVSHLSACSCHCLLPSAHVDWL